MSTLAVNTITNAAGGNTATINGMTPTAQSLQGFRNRLINGDMRIDQRSAGASSTAGNGTYTTCDRWMTYSSQASRFTVQQNAGSITPPAGFRNYLGATSSSAYSVSAGDYFSINQVIEGFNVADFGWGTASAQAITISFWVRSSLTGTFGGSLVNVGGTRSYPYTYTISAANTWEQKSITIPGDTTGTWNTTNLAGIVVLFGLGAGSTFSGTAGSWTAGNLVSATGAVSVVGTNGATFYITGVQLEAGSVATPFERRPYGTELMLCQRYYYRLNAPQFSFFATAQCASTTAAGGVVPFPVTMRVAPQALEQTGTAANYSVYHSGITTGCSLVPIFSQTTTNNCYVFFQVASGLTAGRAADLRSDNANAFLGFPAEL